MTPDQIDLILALRDDRKLGPKRIRAELLRHHDLRLSSVTIWKVLHVQYTAIDDCTRLRVLSLYPARTTVNAVHFLENRMIEEFPFLLQRVQTDRGGEFFATAFQDALRRYCIKFRPTRPGAFHLNGKVERSQQTDWVEFYSTVDLNDPSLPDGIEEWQFFYNWHRPHSALNGHTPMERCCELVEATPLDEEVEAHYDVKHERARVRNFLVDQRLAELKGSLRSPHLKGATDKLDILTFPPQRQCSQSIPLLSCELHMAYRDTQLNCQLSPKTVMEKAP